MAGGEIVKATAAASVPAFGPAIIEILGVQVPVLALALSVLGLILARMVAPPPSRRLRPREDIALTILLTILLFLIVTGAFTGRPLGVGMAFVWAVGLGFSGLLVVEFFGKSVMAALRAFASSLSGAGGKGDDSNAG